jgi:hypothetical protein
MTGDRQVWEEAPGPLPSKVPIRKAENRSRRRFAPGGFSFGWLQLRLAPTLLFPVRIERAGDVLFSAFITSRVGPLTLPFTAGGSLRVCLMINNRCSRTSMRWESSLRSSSNCEPDGWESCGRPFVIWTPLFILNSRTNYLYGLRAEASVHYFTQHGRLFTAEPSEVMEFGPTAFSVWKFHRGVSRRVDNALALTAF